MNLGKHYMPYLRTLGRCTEAWPSPLTPAAVAKNPHLIASLNLTYK